MSTDVIVMTFPENSVTYEAFSRLKTSEASSSLSTAVIVERAEDGRMSIPEGDSATFGAGTLGGSVIGMLIGALGGPIGLLLGWGAGAATGALLDLDKGVEDDAVMSRFASTVKPGRNAIVAEGDEQDPGVLDAFVKEFNGSIERASRDEVVAELEAQEIAAEDAAAAARKAMHAKRKEERHEEMDARIEKLKAKFKH